MSMFSTLAGVMFLGFFLIVMPLSLYFFAKRFPKKYPDFIGFPDDPATMRDPPPSVGSDETRSDQ